MTIHDATEVAYKNGYAAGKRDAMKWIPVTEPPKDGESVLCFIVKPYISYKDIATYHSCLEEFNKYDFAGRKEGGFVDYDSEVGYFTKIGVTHWMPLPEPPKEDA